MKRDLDVSLLLGDNREVLDLFIPDDSIDSVVTDPPYELDFMGKGWDRSGIANDVGMWREVLRVMKPGAYLLAFSGTRTYHRMVCAIEDAGFEIRDQMAWVYGSGFPKSLDVSKAIDKLDATQAQRERRLRFTEWMRSTGLTSAQINDLTSTNMGGHYLTAAAQPAVCTRDHFEALRMFIACDVPDWIEQMVDERTVESENYKAREVVGTAVGLDTQKSRPGIPLQDGTLRREYQITTANTPEAQQWEGWGTALKPAWEPICVARKPFKGTVAANVIRHGVGALNIDACRVALAAGEVVSTPQSDPNNRVGAVAATAFVVQDDIAAMHAAQAASVERTNRLGRWPANIIHDGSPEVQAMFPHTKTGVCPADASGGYSGGLERRDDRSVANGGDEGNASRYFKSVAWDDEAIELTRRFYYCPKASKSDRGAGNSHPTVKPTELMRYLVRLVTPPGGRCLDHFMGSGSTGKACVLEGFDFTGIDLTAEYEPISRGRIEAAKGGA